MMAYDMDKGTWDAVEKAVSQDTGPTGNGGNNGNGKGNNKGGPRISAAGRTMAGFALAVNPTTGSPIPSTSDTALGVVIGGGWIPQKSSTTPSVLASDLIGLVTEADLISINKSGDVDGSTFVWTVAPLGGNGGQNVNANLGQVVGARVVIAPGGGKAVVVGGVVKGGNAGAGSGMPLGSLPVVDMATGAVISQVSPMRYSKRKSAVTSKWEKVNEEEEEEEKEENNKCSLFLARFLLQFPLQMRY